MATVLVVDDSFVMRNNLRRIFEKAGHEVVAEAANGRQAVLSFTKYNPDIITMDISMPVMDGIETTKKITKNSKNAKIIIVSAFDQRKKVFEAIENGAKHYIIKPITKIKVLDVLEKVLSMSPTKQDSKKNAAEGKNSTKNS
ncbi:MAG: response regulator [Halothermotrichaceae bacterium]